MAFFGKKKGGDEGDSNSEPDPGKFEIHPEKAARFFEHAKTAYETTNYEYAMQLWLRGMGWDPTSMIALESFFTSAASFLGAQEGKKTKPPSKETYKAVEEAKGDLGRYLLTLLQWSVKPMDAVLAVRGADLASKLGLDEPAYWIGLRARAAAGREAKPRKDLFVKLMEAFSRIQAYEEAVQAGEAAIRIDPTDGDLAGRVKNLAAQATMASGGYDQSGEAGGFRKNIRDAEKQRELEEAERIVKTEEAIDRLVRTAEEQYKEKPDDNAVVTNYAKRLLERGTPEDEGTAWKVLDRAYQRTKEFRFRKMAGEIKLRRARRKLGEYKSQAEAHPEDRAKQEVYRKARMQFLEMEIEEMKAWEGAYPTDLTLKFELGKRYFDSGKYEESIEKFQKSQGDSKVRIPSLHYLAQSFLQIAWLDESIETFRKSMEAHRVTDDELGMDLRYGLMTALQTKAEMRRDLDSAFEAEKIASSIAIQQISYRDIRERREELKKLIADISKGDAA